MIVCNGKLVNYLRARDNIRTMFMPAVPTFRLAGIRIGLVHTVDPSFSPTAYLISKYDLTQICAAE